MAKVAEVAEILGLELGEEFYLTGNDSVFKLTRHGLARKHDDTVWVSDNGMLGKIIAGEVKIIDTQKRLKLGEEYYIPSFGDVAEVDCCVWEDDDFDERCYAQGVVFKDKEGAIEMLDKIIAFVKQERKITE